MGTLIPTDPDHDPGDLSNFHPDGNGSTDRDKFSLSGFDLITTAPLSIGSYLINLRVSDDENEYLDKNFTISAFQIPIKTMIMMGLPMPRNKPLGQAIIILTLTVMDFPMHSKSQMEQIQEIQNQLSTNLQPLLN